MSRAADVPTGTEVTPQSPIVVNAVRDVRGTLKRKQLAMREPPLYPGVADDTNHTIMPGQMLMLVRGDGDDRAAYDEAFTVVASANGLGPGLAKKTRYTTDQMKLRVRDGLTFGGIARGTVDATKTARQGLATQLGGTYTIPHTGYETIFAGQYLVWDVPEPTLERNRLIYGQPSTLMPFIIRPLQSELKRAGVTASRMRDAIFREAPTPVDPATAKDHHRHAAEMLANFVATQQVLAMQRFEQALKLADLTEAQAVNLSETEKEVRRDLCDAEIAGIAFGVDEREKSIRVLAALLGLTQEQGVECSRAVSDWFASFALHDSVDDDFPNSREPGTREPRADWAGDMLQHQQNALPNLLSSVMIAEYDIRRRVFGKALTDAKPGQSVDVLLGNFS